MTFFPDNTAIAMLSKTPFVSLRPVFLIAVGLGLVTFVFPRSAMAQDSTPVIQVPDTADAVVQVRGMACSACAQRMKSTLEDVDGVDRVTVLLEKQNVVLTLGAKSTPSDQSLREAVTNAGYEFRTAVFAKAHENEESDG